MEKTCIVLDQNAKLILNQLQIKLLTQNTSYIVRLALSHLGEKILGQNSSIAILPNSTELSIPTVNLPGMNERIVRTQMERWQLTAEEYSAIVQKLINDFAASGGTMKNPENVIWKACSRYAHERDIQKRAAAAQNTPPADGNGEQPKLRPDGSLPSIYAYQDED